MLRNTLTSLGLLSLVSFANAQSLTPAEIAAMVDEKMGAVDQFSELLNDPDPDRALIAMNIMIGHEDPQINRMALQYGLTSTSPAVRRAALKAYFDSSPMLNIYVDGTKLDAAAFNSAITRASGTVDTNGIGYLSYKAAAFDPDNACYDYQPDPRYCLVSLSENNVGILLWGRWASLSLSEAGVLVGSVQVGNLTPSVSINIPVTQ